jgi:hypothetical protein
LLQVDGSGSGIDTDLLDGLSSATFATASSVSELQTVDTDLSTRIDAVEASSSVLDDRLGAVEEETRIQNIIRVATSGGDFSSLNDAIASISDASLINPYVVQVGPGLFTVNAVVTLGSGVHLRGAGKDATIIRGNITGDGIGTALGVVRLSDGSSISHLTVENTAQSGFFSGIRVLDISESAPTAIPSIDTRIEDVAVLIPGFGTSASGISIDDADLVIRRVDIRNSGSFSSRYGILVVDSESTVYIEDSNIHASGGTFNTGLFVTNGTVIGRNLDIFGDSVGLYAEGVASTQLSNSRVRSSDTGIVLTNTASVISRSNSIEAPTTINNASSGTVVCVFSSDELAAELGSNCS